MRADQRLTVWALVEEYQRQLRLRGACDSGDLLLLAVDSVRDRPLGPPCTAVVVDEVQDLTGSGVRLLHALVGGGQQAVYPGGLTPAEAGTRVVDAERSGAQVATPTYPTPAARRDGLVS